MGLRGWSASRCARTSKARSPALARARGPRAPLPFPFLVSPPRLAVERPPSPSRSPPRPGRGGAAIGRGCAAKTATSAEAVRAPARRAGAQPCRAGPRCRWWPAPTGRQLPGPVCARYWRLAGRPLPPASSQSAPRRLTIATAAAGSEGRGAGRASTWARPPVLGQAKAACRSPAVQCRGPGAGKAARRASRRDGSTGPSAAREERTGLAGAGVALRWEDAGRQTTMSTGRS